MIPLRRFAPLRWLAVLLLLAACQSGKEDEADLTPEPIAGAALYEVLTANTLTSSGGTLWQKWDYASLHRGDAGSSAEGTTAEATTAEGVTAGTRKSGGDMTGRIAWSGETELGQGTWELTPDGLYCRTWDNDWGGGGRGCFKVSRTPHTLVFEHVSGTRGSATRYVYLLLPGNPYGL